MIWWCYTFSDFLTLWRTKASDECVACCDVYMIRDTGTVNTIHSIIPGVSFERPHQYHFLKLFVVPRSSDNDPKKGTFRWHEAVLTDCSRFRQSHSCFIYCKRSIMYHCTLQSWEPRRCGQCQFSVKCALIFVFTCCDLGNLPRQFDCSRVNSWIWGFNVVPWAIVGLLPVLYLVKRTTNWFRLIQFAVLCTRRHVKAILQSKLV